MQLEGRNLSFSYSSRLVLKSISLKLEEGERLGITAPSGYGKTTLARILAGYIKPESGEVLLDGVRLKKRGVSPVQLISQHPEQGVNPKWQMRKVLQEAGKLDEDVINALGIQKQWLSRYPGELSGGELQRFCTARALGRETRFVIADEISTMLDVITQAQIWDYLVKESIKRNIGMIVISHNPSLINRVCTRVMQLDTEPQLK